MSQPRILLLQTREPGDPVIAEEIRIFARNAHVPVENIVPHNLLIGPPTIHAARQLDAIMIGGSGEYFVSRGNLPHFDGTLEFLREVAAADQPVFASCFGFQLIVRALGGEVIFAPENMELGTYPITLTGAGRQDDLFGRLPETFDAHLGHKDQATALPNGVVSLAYSERSPFQAIRIPGKPIWATQFHPEVTREENLGRFKRYIDLYAAQVDTVNLQATIARFTPAPDSESLIPAFMELVFGPRVG